ncbi:MAG: choice-of-anchor D domain-containing protein [Janthinobacterium lividum]
MRSRLAALLLSLPFAVALPVAAQSCTGLCQQQVSCPNGGTTSVSGVVYAPNGIDPLPGILVYVPNAAVASFAPGVSCAVAGQPPSGSPLIGTTTAVDGSFTLTNVPVGTNIPVVIQTGRWRRQGTIPATTACTNTAFSTRFPQTQAEGDIPKIAVVTGSADAVECVLRKVGIADTEFTDNTGSGRINLYTASGSPGAVIDPGTTAGDSLLGTTNSLNNYDVLMLPCEGASFLKDSGQLANLVEFANAGGRVYASHFSYDWLYNNPPFNTVVDWAPNQHTLPDGTATVDTDFAQGQVLSQWLYDVGATTVPGQVAISTLRHDFNAVNPPTQTWLTLNNATYGNPIMQFTFDTPVGAPTAACGRVLFNEYHVENEPKNLAKLSFPLECNPGPMTAQEKLLEFSLFDLTGDGSPPTLTPLTRDFGTEPVGFSSGTQQFFWKNNTLFPVTVSSAATTGDFAVTRNTCTSVAVAGSCEIDAIFTPTALGARTGSLTVTSSTGTLSAALTGNGVSPLTISSAILSFGKVDVGASATQTMTLTNTTPAGIPIPLPVATGDFATGSTCGVSLAAQSSCTVSVIFTPTATGTRNGTLNIAETTLTGSTVGSTPLLSTSLSGTGVDFLVAIGPNSAATIAGLSTTTTSTTSPIAGFANPVTLLCTTTAPASTCTLATGGFTPDAAVSDAVTIHTTSQYTVVGYSSFGNPGRSGHTIRDSLLCLFTVSSTLLLLRKRRRTAALFSKCIVFTLCAVAMTTFLSGCSGKYPAQNAPYTPAGTYSYTVSATDGFLRHSATYTLVVTAK